jgi:hypothetical protein
MQKEQYLGDGVYASFVGWQFCLHAPRENGDHVATSIRWCFAPSMSVAAKLRIESSSAAMA